MKWDQSFLIGIDQIDAQHKKIFEILLRIENSVAKRDPWHILRFQLEELGSYMKFHLAVEESLLEVIGYPARDAHCDSHANIMAQIGELESGLKQSLSASELVVFFEKWFVRHVLSSDREYVNYIRNELPGLMRAKP